MAFKRSGVRFPLSPPEPPRKSYGFRGFALSAARWSAGYPGLGAQPARPPPPVTTNRRLAIVVYEDRTARTYPATARGHAIHPSIVALGTVLEQALQLKDDERGESMARLLRSFEAADGDELDAAAWDAAWSATLDRRVTEIARARSSSSTATKHGRRRAPPSPAGGEARATSASPRATSSPAPPPSRRPASPPAGSSASKRACLQAAIVILRRSCRSQPAPSATS
jgi:hypothetical protein